MGIAPGCTSVNKSFKLSGNVCPIRRRYRYDDVCPLVVVHYFINIIMLNMDFSRSSLPYRNLLLRFGTA